MFVVYIKDIFLIIRRNLILIFISLNKKIRENIGLFYINDKDEIEVVLGCVIIVFCSWVVFDLIKF